MSRNSYLQFLDQQSAWQRCNRRCPEQQEFFWWVLAAQRPPTPPLTLRFKNLSLVPVSLNLLWGFKKHFHFPMFRFLKFLLVLSISRKHEFTVSCFRQRAKSRTSERSIHLHLELTRTGWLSLELNLKWSSRWMISKWAVMMILISLGRVVSGWRVRNNQDWTLIGKKSPQVGFRAKIHVLGQSSPSLLTAGPTNVLPGWEGDDFISGGRRCC